MLAVFYIWANFFLKKVFQNFADSKITPTFASAKGKDNDSFRETILKNVFSNKNCLVV